MTEKVLAGEDFAALLDALVSEWQRTHDPAVADLIDAADLKVSAEPLTTDEEWERACLTRSPRTFRALTTRLLTGKSPAVTKRLAAIRETEDPRLSKVLVDAMRRPPFRNDTTRPFWKLLFETLTALGDVRVLDELTELEAGYDVIMSNDTAPFIRAQARSTIKALSKMKPGVSDTEWVAAHRQRLQGALDDVARSKVKPDFSALYSAVWNAPDDDAPRAVLADALTEAGDPRGAFITEQLASRVAKKMESSAFVDTLLGPLSTAVVHPTFERGFPVSAPMFIKKRKWIEEAIDLPNWATFRRLELFNRPFPDAWEKPAVALLMSPALKSLQALAVSAAMPVWLEPVLERVMTLEVHGAKDDAMRARFEAWRGAKTGRLLSFVSGNM